jgi:hypothetical protein
MQLLRLSRSDMVGLVLISVVIHALYCIQVFVALPAMALPGLAGLAFLIFLPHDALMTALPPAWPVHDDGVIDYGRLCGKLAEALPASVVYACIIFAVVILVRQLKRKQNDAA